MTAPALASATRRYGRRCSYSSANSASDITSPQSWNRSVTDRRCGEVNNPVERPCAHAIVEISRAVVVFPFVPVMCTVG